MSDKNRRLIDTLIVELKRYSTIQGFVGEPAKIGSDWGSYLSSYESDKYATLSQKDLAMALIFYYTKKYEKYTENWLSTTRLSTTRISTKYSTSI